MNNKGISRYVIKRLPRYYRFLVDLSAAGIKKISSGELARKMGVTASQIRQDLNCFGGFGQQGYGYSTDLLREEIGTILGIDTPKKIVLIGVGNLGRAIALHLNFEEKGFNLIGIFDKKGSIKVVKHADFAVLDKNTFKVLMTVRAVNVIYTK